MPAFTLCPHLLYARIYSTPVLTLRPHSSTFPPFYVIKMIAIPTFPARWHKILQVSFWVSLLVTQELLSIFLLNVKLTGSLCSASGKSILITTYATVFVSQLVHTIFLCSAGGIKDGNAGNGVGGKESQHGKLATIVINVVLGVSMLAWMIPCIYAVHSMWIDARRDEWNLRSIPFADLLVVFAAPKTKTTPLPARLHHWHQRQRRKGRSIASEPLLQEHETSIEDMEFFR
jgi:hypothetical protein